VLRGGAWDDGPGFLSSANRIRNAPVNRNYFTGMRIARTL